MPSVVLLMGDRPQVFSPVSSRSSSPTSTASHSSSSQPELEPFPFLDFPADIRNQLYDSLTADPQTLNSLSQTCRFISGEVEDWLYKSPTLRSRRGLATFQKALKNDSSRRKMIRKIVWRTGAEFMLPIEVNEAGVKRRSFSIDEDTEDMDQRFVLEQLGTMPRLKHLAVEGDMDGKDEPRSADELARFNGLFKMAALSDSSVMGGLTGLRSCQLDFGRSSPSTLWHLWDVRAIMFHPTLQSLTLVNAHIQHFPRPEDEQRHCTPLKTLTLEKCNLWADGLAAILAIPEALEELRVSQVRKLTVVCLPPEDEWDVIVVVPDTRKGLWSDVVSALVEAEQGEYLKRLQMTPYNRWGSVGPTESQVDFHDLPELEDLVIETRVRPAGLPSHLRRIEGAASNLIRWTGL